MRLALVLGGLSAALPLPPSAFFSPSSCAFSCPVAKESCNARRASAITNPPPKDRFMRGVIYESKDFDQPLPYRARTTGSVQPVRRVEWTDRRRLFHCHTGNRPRFPARSNSEGFRAIPRALFSGIISPHSNWRQRKEQQWLR